MPRSSTRSEATAYHQLRRHFSTQMCRCIARMVSFAMQPFVTDHSLKSHATTRRYATMPQSALEMANDLVMAQIQMGQLQAEQVQDALRQTHASLAALK